MKETAKPRPALPGALHFVFGNSRHAALTGLCSKTIKLATPSWPLSQKGMPFQTPCPNEKILFKQARPTATLLNF